ncbi:pirin family protein [Shewanella submarina]|uniref:Pirin family protein n=1 Tax=Shewanella submarina TaxID=2016376 RepID=A0ABV7GKI0_9GAMM|nr:pirin-like C-terminal cupin domain-containing protein [Shewanella submarina]MCL1036187.1 pirin family protein [Shewanella submarina]
MQTHTDGFTPKNTQTSQVPAANLHQSSGIISPQLIDNHKGFKALGFREKQFSGLMDPLVMVDHFTMDRPTFGAHPHAGMSAVTVMFEDSEGLFHNQDSLGNELDLLPGDLYWLKAGQGAVHDEAPRPGSKTHALQVFVNLPATLKQSAPEALHVSAATMPILAAQDYRVRLVLGSSNGVEGVQAPAGGVTILDGTLSNKGKFRHTAKASQGVWVHAIDGTLSVNVQGESLTIPAGKSAAFRNDQQDLPLIFEGEGPVHFVMLSGDAIQEPFVQQGPFVMSNEREIVAVQQAYQDGLLGSID